MGRKLYNIDVSQNIQPEKLWFYYLEISVSDGLYY